MVDYGLMRTKTIKPALSLLMEMYSHNEVEFMVIKPLATNHIQDAIDAYHCGIQPCIVVTERGNGNWQFRNGGLFAQALIEFMTGLHTYPLTGTVEAFRGKKFNELSRLHQRRLRSHELELKKYCLEIDIDNDSEFIRCSELLTAFN
ncbi:hypothetical protein [Photobacterium leiognathi]|uniref:hypothetical protein n=1 Tax=Photobacterium leiognathi TaxID=553611 RepID=UPI002981F76F|nr:hypothetical protein [Photobacterium leiognathi]